LTRRNALRPKGGECVGGDAIACTMVQDRVAPIIDDAQLIEQLLHASPLVGIYLADVR
jgi:hypothetical protein